MIKLTNVIKLFGDFEALKDLNCEIPEGSIYGLVGSNGAGKSTFLRIVTGIYKPNQGLVQFDGRNVWDNPDVKNDYVFLPDELYFLPGADLKRMAKVYATYYKNFSKERYEKLTMSFGLDPNKKLSSFSKGMRRQAAIILALSCKPKYYFFDETFDGLDPIMRNNVKKLIYEDVCERGCTVVITSHSLRELEDLCDQLTLLHKGGIVFESEVEKIKTSLFKVQVAFDHDIDIPSSLSAECINLKKNGRVTTLIIRGDRDATEQELGAHHPILCDILPLSLEEVFSYEVEALGYAFDEVTDLSETENGKDQ